MWFDTGIAGEDWHHRHTGCNVNRSPQPNGLSPFPMLSGPIRRSPLRWRPWAIVRILRSRTLTIIVTVSVEVPVTRYLADAFEIGVFATANNRGRTPGTGATGTGNARLARPSMAEPVDPTANTVSPN